MTEPGVLIRCGLAVVGIAVFPVIAAAGETMVTPCVDALEQVITLKTWTPVFKFVGGKQQFIKDADRAAEIARFQEVIDASCSSEPQARHNEESQAHLLHTVRSPECAIERDKLAFMEKPGSRDPPDVAAAQRTLVIEKCSLDAPTDVWLLQMVWAPRR